VSNCWTFLSASLVAHSLPVLNRATSSISSISFPLTQLRTLFRSCRVFFRCAALCFQCVAHSFCKTPGVWVSQTVLLSLLFSPKPLRLCASALSVSFSFRLCSWLHDDVFALSDICHSLFSPTCSLLAAAWRLSFLLCAPRSVCLQSLAASFAKCRGMASAGFLGGHPGGYLLKSPSHT
jgi:hypothetical protein